MARRLSAGTLRALLLEIASSGRGERVLAIAVAQTIFLSASWSSR